MTTICRKCNHDHLCYCGNPEGDNLGFCCECDTDNLDEERVCGPWAIGQETLDEPSGPLTA